MQKPHSIAVVFASAAPQCAARDWSAWRLISAIPFTRMIADPCFRYLREKLVKSPNPRRLNTEPVFLIIRQVFAAKEIHFFDVCASLRG